MTIRQVEFCNVKLELTIEFNFEIYISVLVICVYKIKNAYYNIKHIICTYDVYIKAHISNNALFYFQATKIYYFS